MNELREKLLKALQLELGYFDRPTPEMAATAAWNSTERKKTSTPAAVLVLLGQRLGSRDFELLVTRRTETVETHKGQMAFPGGMADEGETSAQTALRETFEEVGIDSSLVEVLGELPGLWTPTGFWITPMVGLLTCAVEDAPLSYSHAEIAEALWIPLSVLLDPNTYGQELLERAGIRYVTHVFTVPPHRIWGATGAIIKNLLDRLAAFT
jgi:8-oxo-dGTP pyrophosphatase MutT (NUDIX family)